jgi:hypothetical protein
LEWVFFAFIVSALINGLQSSTPPDPIIATVWSAGLGSLILGGLESIRNWLKHRDK